LKQFLDTKEAAVWSGIKINTLRQWRARGEGPPFSRVGRKILYDVGKFQKWIERGEHTPPGKSRMNRNHDGGA